MEFIIISGSSELINDIKPMWLELQKHHAEKSEFFSKEMAAVEFEKRVADILENADKVLVNIARYSGDSNLGYCITTIRKDRGEIDSLFVHKNARKLGLGKILMQNAIEWLDDNNVRSKTLSVVVGNEEVAEFYKSVGFYPRTVTYYHKEDF